MNYLSVSNFEVRRIALQFAMDIHRGEGRLIDDILDSAKKINEWFGEVLFSLPLEDTTDEIPF